MLTETQDGNDIAFPVTSDPKNFDKRSGNRLERTIFNHRLLVLIISAVVSLFLGFHALQLHVNASFDRMLPRSHPYIKNYLDNKSNLIGVGNSIRVVVENTQGDIYDPEYLLVLRKVTDAMYLQPGIDRAWMKSLWMPFVRWWAITEQGTDNGQLMPDGFDFSPQAIDKLKFNISRSSAVGTLIAEDFKSSMVYLPLLDSYADGKPLDYGALGQDLEHKLRGLENDKIKIHIVGFGKLVGDLIEGLGRILGFFAASALISSLFVFFYTRCLRSTLLLVSASLLGVVWLLGIMQLLGYDLDPYSILVPFLVFSIGLSHGAQKMNGIMQDIGRGTHKYVAARYTFRRLFLAGLTALLTNIIGFAVLAIIDIPVIRDMAITTSIGVSVLIFTKLVLIPVLLSYIGVSPVAAKRSVGAEAEKAARASFVSRLWQWLDKFTYRGWATAAVIAAAVLAAVAFAVSLRISIGDLDPGAPELRADSRYNRDVAFVTDHFGLSNDQFVTMVKLAPYTCHEYQTLALADELGWTLLNTPGVLAVNSLAEKAKSMVMLNSEGNPRQYALPRDDRVLGSMVQSVMSIAPDEMVADCVVYPITAYLSDHKAETLARTLAVVEDFSARHSDAKVQFLPAAGSAGIEAVTNIVVKESNRRMLVVLYLSVAALCFLTFRSWRAVVIAILPLLITSMLCEALMVWLGIGMKVATLPVVALGVGVGVDYALYLLSVQLSLQRQGCSLTAAYRGSLNFTGKIVALVGFTMAASVVTWVWSPIKFQADMGLLLTFMFLWNMLGALVMIPSLSYFLLPKIAAAPLAATPRKEVPDICA